MGIQHFNRGGYQLGQHPPLKILDAHPLWHHWRWAKQKILSFTLQVFLSKKVKKGESTLYAILTSHRERSYASEFFISGSAIKFLLHVMPFSHELKYTSCTRLCYCTVNVLQQKSGLFLLKKFNGKNNSILPCVTVKLAATTIVIHGGKKETRFLVLTFFFLNAWAFIWSNQTEGKIW